MKIEATNAPAFVRHLQLLSKLSTEEHAAPYPHDLYTKLRFLEARAHRITTAECNGTIDEDKASKQLNKIKEQVNKLLKVTTLFINGDPRGYALKLKESEAKELGIYQDWGGYGILAPEF